MPHHKSQDCHRPCAKKGYYEHNKVGCCAYRHKDYYDRACKPCCYIRPQFCYTRKIRYHLNPDRRYPCKFDSCAPYDCYDHHGHDYDYDYESDYSHNGDY